MPIYSFIIPMPGNIDKMVRRTMSVRKKREDVFNSELVMGASFSSKYEFPILLPTNFKPSEAIPFKYALRAKKRNQWVHFFIDDYQFERVWNRPGQYLNLLKSFEGIVTTDFSLYREMALAMQIWNTYRNRALAYWFQSQGLNIVPNVRWGDHRTYDFAFEGLPQGASVAVSTNGCIQGRLNRRYFQKGLARMVEVLRPRTIVNYSQTPGDIFGEYREAGIDIIAIENYAQTVRKAAL
ncbi:DUF4417 domain-containing protein [Deltaproteobacteria bacterium OttesenSCG-928-M10]|nr:DUF4417 domain-containing protein [Deltaproteobacteria bacterium OttesenSCG-928-M10]